MKEQFIKLTVWEDHDLGLMFEWKRTNSKGKNKTGGDVEVLYFTQAEFDDWADRHDQVEWVAECEVK